MAMFPYVTSIKDAPTQPFKLKRASVYDSLVACLNKNIPLLSAVDKKYLANQYMGNALLAKLHLNAAVYTGNFSMGKSRFGHR
jgi:hypothetical protein